MNIITEKGKSPLYLLLSRHQSDIVQTLLPVILDKGADPNLGHYPPLEIATLLQQQAVVKSLLNYGAKVDIKNKRCQTPLIGASRMCFLEDKGMFCPVILHVTQNTSLFESLIHRSDAYFIILLWCPVVLS